MTSESAKSESPSRSADFSINGVRKLPLLVEQAESDGLPVIIYWQGTMEEHTQRLFKTLGVLVRFV